MPPRFPSGALAPAIAGRGRYLRPTAARVSGRFGGQNIGIEIIGLRDCAKIPEQLRLTYEIMLQRLQTELTQMAKSVVPGGPDGRLGRQVHARMVRGGSTQRIVIGTIGSEFARALDRGFTSKPKNAKALRFVIDGDVYFRMRVRVAGRHFLPKWVAMAPPIIEAVYDSSFYNIKDLV